MTEIKKHLLDYLLFLTAGIFFLILLNIFRGERLAQFLAVIAFSAFYIAWGFYHHIIDDSLHLKSVVEYILIAFTVIFLMKIIVFP